MKPSSHTKKQISQQRPVRQGDGASRKSIGQIEWLQMRVAAAEETWKEAKEQFSQAKRRRKLAKLFAKRAKKHAKKAEENLDQARNALADAKAQAAAMQWHVAPRKVGKKARPLSRKRATPRRSARKAAPTAEQAASHEPSSIVLGTPAEAIPGYAHVPAVLPSITGGEAPAVS